MRLRAAPAGGRGGPGPARAWPRPIARLALGGADAQNALGVCLLALGGTLPLALLPPAGAALAVAAADVLSLAALRTLTVAGAWPRS